MAYKFNMAIGRIRRWWRCLLYMKLSYNEDHVENGCQLYWMHIFLLFFPKTLVWTILKELTYFYLYIIKVQCSMNWWMFLSEIRLWNKLLHLTNVLGSKNRTVEYQSDKVWSVLLFFFDIWKKVIID